MSACSSPASTMRRSPAAQPSVRWRIVVISPCETVIPLARKKDRTSAGVNARSALSSSSAIPAMRRRDHADQPRAAPGRGRRAALPGTAWTNADSMSASSGVPIRWTSSRRRPRCGGGSPAARARATDPCRSIPHGEPSPGSPGAARRRSVRSADRRSERSTSPRWNETHTTAVSGSASIIRAQRARSLVLPAPAGAVTSVKVQGSSIAPVSRSSSRGRATSSSPASGTERPRCIVVADALPHGNPPVHRSTPGQQISAV